MQKFNLHFVILMDKDFWYEKTIYVEFDVENLGYARLHWAAEDMAKKRSEDMKHSPSHRYILLAKVEEGVGGYPKDLFGIRIEDFINV